MSISRPNTVAFTVLITIVSCLSLKGFTLNQTPWDTLGQGFNNWCYALAIAPNGDVFAGGYFTEAGGQPANRIARWDGTAWSPLGAGLDGPCEAIAIAPNGDVFVGGNFTTAGGTPANNIAKWNGTAWSPIGAGLSGPCYDIEIASNGDVYAGGIFWDAGGTTVNNVAVWNGTAWSGLGMGVNSQVSDMVLDSNDDLYVGGQFGMAGGSNIQYLAKWDGTAWSQVGPTPVNSPVTALIVDDMDNLYIAGIFNTPATGIAKWDGTSWSPLGTGLNLDTHGMAFDNEGNLHVVGQFSFAGNYPNHFNAKWNGAFWVNTCSDFGGWGNAIAIDDDNTIYSGGVFQNIDGCPVNYIASQDGNTDACIQEEDCLETLAIYSNLSWKTNTTSEPGWLLPGFDDSGWAGAAYDTDCGQNNNVYSSQSLPIWDEPRSDEVYLRKTFNIPDLSKVNAADVQSQADDDHILYLNGTIVHQDNDGDPAESLYTQDIKNLLVQGENVFAVYAHDAIDMCESFYLRSYIQINSVELIDTLLTTPEICGNANGIITVSTLGTDTLTFSLDSISFQVENLFENLPAGDYRVFVRNQEGCLDFQDVTIEFVDGPVVDNISPTPAGCTVNNGTLTVLASGGTGQITYSINGTTFQPSNQFTNLSMGSYTVTVQDENGCTASLGTTIALAAPPTISSITPTTSGCTVDNGTLQVTATGGTGQVLYSIDGNNFQSSGFFQNLGVGNYTITIQDSNGCTASQPATILATNPPVINTILPTASGCSVSNGSFEITASGGTGTIEYSLDGISFQSGNIFQSLGVGAYTVTIQDANGCTATQDATISPSNPPVLDNVTVTNATCGNNNGSLQITATGGTGALEYSLDGINFQTGNTFNLLPAGDFTISIQDANGCVTTEAASVGNEDGPQILTITGTDATCGNDNGTVAIDATGGMAPLMYSVNGSAFQSNNIFTGLPAGDIAIIVQDANGCTATGNTTLTQLTGPMIDNFLIQNTTCGNDDGEAHINSSGGTGALEYSIDGLNFQASPDFVGLPSGDYTLSVVDENNCLAEVAISILGSDGPVIDNITGVNAICNMNNGNITISASSGTAPLTYSIDGSTFQNGSDFQNLAAASYTVTVQDAAGCASTQMVTLQQEGAPAILQIVVVDASCQTPSSLNVIAEGGTGQLLYSIDGTTFQADPIFENLPAGDYSITVQDENQCIDSASSTVSEAPAPIIESVTGTDASCSGDDGVISIVASGGLGLLQYSLDGITFQANPLFNNVQAGSYEVSVQDEGGCIVTEVILLSQTLSPQINNVAVSAAECGANGSLDISATGGSGSLIYSINGGQPSTKPEFYDLLPGEYLVTVMDSSGCTGSLTVQVPSECDLFIPTVFSPNNDGFNDIFQAFAANGTDATIEEFFVFDRWGGIRHEAKNFAISSIEHWWDGTSNGKDASPGVYIYYFKINLGGQEIIEKGEISLIR